jgi:hypothetical protein
MFFSDLHVQILARGVLQPGEVLIGQTVTDYMPWWAFGLIRRQHLVLATDQRVVIFDHRYDLLKVNQVLHSVESLPWGSVAHAKVTGLFKKKLKLRGTNEHGRPVDISAKIPSSFLPWGTTMKNNMEGARSLAATHQSRAHGGAPALSYAPPAQLAPPGAYGPPMPAVNAPGYQSAPPPANPYGVAPVAIQPSPFAPPRQY